MEKQPASSTPSTAPLPPDHPAVANVGHAYDLFHLILRNVSQATERGLAGAGRWIADGREQGVSIPGVRGTPVLVNGMHLSLNLTLGAAMNATELLLGQHSRTGPANETMVVYNMCNGMLSVAAEQSVLIRACLDCNDTDMFSAYTAVAQMGKYSREAAVRVFASQVRVPVEEAELAIWQELPQEDPMGGPSPQPTASDLFTTVGRELWTPPAGAPGAPPASVN